MIKRITTILSVCALYKPVMGVPVDNNIETKPLAVTEVRSGIIKEIIISGNSIITEVAITSVMQSKVGQPFVESALRSDEQSIMNLGFFKDVKVVSKKLNEFEYEIIVETAENPLIQEIKVTGNTVISTEEIKGIIAVHQPTSSIYNLRSAQPINNAISDLYFNKGYFAQIDLIPSTQNPNILEVRIIEKVVGEIEINGLTRTKEWVIRRLIKTTPGEPFNMLKWEADRRRLNATRWFESVTSQGRETGELGYTDLILNLKESSTGEFKLGVTMPTNGSVAGAVSFRDTNFLGCGQTIGANLQKTIGGRGFMSGLGGSIDYINPFLDNHETTISARIFSIVNNNFTTSGFGAIEAPIRGKFDERRTGASLNFSRPFNNNFVGSVGATYERIETIDKDVKSHHYIEQNGHLLTVPFQIAYDCIDVAYDPHNGYSAKLLVEPGFGKITKTGGIRKIAAFMPEGPYKFLRSYIEGKYFWSPRPPKGKPIDTPMPVVAVRAKVGSTFGRMPFFEQFFVGGADTLRGYSDQRFWGKHMVTVGAEYRHPITKAFNVFGFVDMGSAWGGYPGIKKFDQSSSPRFRIGFGPGAEFATPLGKIRIAFGFNLSGKHEKNNHETHFTIGTSGF